MVSTLKLVTCYGVMFWEAGRCCISVCSLAYKEVSQKGPNIMLPYLTSSLIGNHFRLLLSSHLRICWCIWWRTKCGKWRRIKAACHQSSCHSTTKPVCKASERHSVMDKNIVTRTFSIGAISSGTKALDDFSTSRRHSSAGIRALLWATSSARSLGCSLGSDFQTSRENSYPNILTPDSIPQFTIPSLSVQNSLRSSDKEEGDAETDEGLGSSETEPESSLSASLACSTLSSSSSSSYFSLVLSDRRAERSVSDPFTQRRSLLQREGSNPCSYSEDQHCLDPASRAALSLPHLTKVTTPYGFITLSQSPQMASEEALLCQAGLRRLNKDEDAACCLSKVPVTRTVDNKGNSSHLSGEKKRLTKDLTDSQNKERAVKGEIKASSASSINATVSSSSTPRHPDGKRKRRFYEVIRKHFTSRRKELNHGTDL